MAATRRPVETLRPYPTRLFRPGLCPPLLQAVRERGRGDGGERGGVRCPFLGRSRRDKINRRSPDGMGKDLDEAGG